MLIVTRPFVPAELLFLRLRFVIVPLTIVGSLVENPSYPAGLACLPLGPVDSGLPAQERRLKKVKKKPSAPRCVSAPVVEKMARALPLPRLSPSPRPVPWRTWETSRELN